MQSSCSMTPGKFGNLFPASEVMQKKGKAEKINDLAGQNGRPSNI